MSNSTGQSKVCKFLETGVGTNDCIDQVRAVFFTLANEDEKLSVHGNHIEGIIIEEK